MSREYFQVLASGDAWIVRADFTPSIPCATFDIAIDLALRVAQDRWRFLRKATGVRVQLVDGEIFERTFGREKGE